jgi:hypothetical protein
MRHCQYQALVTLYLPQQGDLQPSLPAQTRRLVARARHHVTHRSKLFSAVATAAGDQPLRPGDAHRVVTGQVNGEDAGQYVVPGEHFGLRFGPMPPAAPYPAGWWPGPDRYALRTGSSPEELR